MHYSRTRLACIIVLTTVAADLSEARGQDEHVFFRHRVHNDQQCCGSDCLYVCLRTLGQHGSKPPGIGGRPPTRFKKGYHCNNW